MKPKQQITSIVGAQNFVPLLILSILFILVNIIPAFAWNFIQERNTIPVSFDGVECQSPWGTGYNYINPTFCDLDGDGDFVSRSNKSP